MSETGEQQQQQRLGSSMNPKIASDSGYGSNKSTQRSSGSSKSHESSVSSESSTAYPPHPNAPIAECQQSHSTSASPSQGGSTSKQRQGKKKSKSDRKASSSEKVIPENSKESTKSGTLTQTLDQSANNTGNAATTPTGARDTQLRDQNQIMSPGSKASSTHDSKALQMAALTHALSCMKKFHKPLTESEINEGNEEMGTVSGNKWQEFFSNDIKVDDSTNEDTFASVVSLDDGIVVYITPSIANILGFPKDMLVGRSFIDFIHPKDRMAFASHITCGMSFPMPVTEQHSPQGSNASAGAARVKSEPFYCRLRQYRGLKTSGFGVVDKTVHYYPFKLSMTLKKVDQSQKENSAPFAVTLAGGPALIGAAGTEEETSSGTSGILNESDSAKSGSNAGNGRAIVQQNVSVPSAAVATNNSVHLVIVANRIKSAYQFPDEAPQNPGKFVTRHSASCHFGHMDSEAISYLGHLPQDLIGNSVLDYYHPEDMGLMKDIYDGVMQEQGKPFRSKPYRFRVYNGTFAMLETDWSCFINPWSWKLEFVIGQHRVVKGPGNPNVFMQPPDEDEHGKGMPDPIQEESAELQNEIKKLLTETVTRRLSDPLRQQSSRRRKDLAALMESLLEGMAKTENSDKSGSQCSGMFSVMERDSVMLGEISPHHDDHSGSNQSSETPPSYNQLNYRENIERFFQSQPKTIRSDESADSGSKMETNQSANRSSDSDSKSSPNIDYSSGSNVRISSGASNEPESGDRDLCASPLTEERLSRHNEAMEKYMIQRHRELRGKSSMTPGSHKECRHRHSEKAETAHGVKRTGNASWDGDTHTAKQPHLDCLPGRHPLPASLAPGAPPGVGCCPGHTNTINLWPPFSITMTPGIPTSTYRSAGAGQTPPPPNPNIPTSFPGLNQCFSAASRPGGGVNHSGAPPVVAAASNSLIAETISMSATTPSAPLLFVPSHQPHHHHHHHPTQFVPQQVQLFPAGVVYQPLGIYGQPSPIMMPAGFLGTMIHPGDQSLNQLEGSTAQTGSASQGEAIGTATLPKVSEKEKAKQKGPGPSGGGKGPKQYYIPGSKDNGHLHGQKSMQIPGTALKPGTSKGGGAGGGMGGTHQKKGNYISHASTAAQNLITTVTRAGAIMSSMAHVSLTCHHSNKQQHASTNEGSGSDESMLSGSMNTNNSLDDDKGSQSNSDQDSLPVWANRMRNDNGAAVAAAGGTAGCGPGGGQVRPRPVRNKQPPWLENIAVTPDLMYRYRIPAGDLSDVLQKDLEALKIFGKQSNMVNDQLSMLYSELNSERKNGDISLHLEEGTTSNCSSGDDEINTKDSGGPRKVKKPIGAHQYSKMVILYEENAPFPPEHEKQKRDAASTSMSKSEAEV